MVRGKRCPWAGSPWETQNDLEPPYDGWDYAEELLYAARLDLLNGSDEFLLKVPHWYSYHVNIVWRRAYW